MSRIYNRDAFRELSRKIAKRHESARRAALEKAKQSAPPDKEVFDSARAIRLYGTISSVTGKPVKDLEAYAERLEYEYYVHCPKVRSIEEFVRFKERWEFL